MDFIYKPRGVCSTSIRMNIDENGKIHNVKFEGGCSGNAQGIEALVEGMKAEDVVEKLKNIKCGFKSTSCPDQLATAIEQYLNQRPQKAAQEC